MESYENLKFWINDLKKTCDDVPFILLGNKSDLIEDIDNLLPDPSRLLPIFHNYQEKSTLVHWLLTSAKTSENVEKAFKSLIKTIFSKK